MAPYTWFFKVTFSTTNLRSLNPKKGHLTTSKGSLWRSLYLVGPPDTPNKMVEVHGSVSKPCTPVVHIKIAGIYGCSSP